MKQDLRELIRNDFVIFDGGTGSMLVELGITPGTLPETWNVDHPEDMTALAQSYFEAGAHIVNANTFGCNGLKFDKEGKYSLENLVRSAVANVKKAIENVDNGIPMTGKLQDCLSGTPEIKGVAAKDRPHYVALDLGPLGKLLKPFGDLDFEEAVAIFAEVIRIGQDAGADLINIETMNDAYETKAALLAAKENSDLPVFVTNVYDESHKLLSGSTPASMVAMLEALGADAIGMNCGLGPVQMLDIVDELVEVASVPVIVNPNAGLPRAENGRTLYDIDDVTFASYMRKIAEKGAVILGGCCGTTPRHIRRLIDAISDLKPCKVSEKNISMISSRTHIVEVGKKPILIGERINPTGKKKFKEALRNHDIDYIIQEALKQEDAGCDALDVNVGLPEIDEVSMMEEAVKELQVITDLPLQIDTTNTEAMEKALRYYNGKALINSVNGKEEIMHAIFPLVKKYGGMVVGLTLDEEGIPSTVEGRVAIAEKIYATAAQYGIAKKDIIIDPLALTVSSGENEALITLATVKAIHENGGNTILGISNVSFGLPAREVITSVFFTMALQNGLSAAIMNPMSAETRKAYNCYLTLAGYDTQCLNYIAYAGDLNVVTTTGKETKKTDTNQEMTLHSAIVKGLHSAAEDCTKKLLETEEPMTIINTYLIPALDEVGKGFENKTVYLPQLLMSAEAASCGFAIIRSYMEAHGGTKEKNGTIVLATVKGDIHDIGKNIVKVLLENYGFEVIDLGKDVPPEVIVEKTVEQHIQLVGLSALMTTTVPAMEETIRQLREKAPWAKVCVGGAVLTKEYADMIGADRYCKDAMQTVSYAQEIFNEISEEIPIFNMLKNM